MSTKAIKLSDMTFDNLSAREKQAQIRKWTSQPDPVGPDKIVSIKNSAIRIDKTIRTVQNLLAAGQLTRVFLPGRKRCCGCRESELAALIGGGK